MTERVQTAIGVLKAASHRVRLRTLAVLHGGGPCVCPMTAILDLATSGVSIHLAGLKSGPGSGARGRRGAGSSTFSSSTRT